MMSPLGHDPSSGVAFECRKKLRVRRARCRIWFLFVERCCNFRAVRVYDTILRTCVRLAVMTTTPTAVTPLVEARARSDVMYAPKPTIGIRANIASFIQSRQTGCCWLEIIVFFSAFVVGPVFSYATTSCGVVIRVSTSLRSGLSFNSSVFHSQASSE